MTIGGQAVLEGVMMRGPSQLGGRRAQARRRHREVPPDRSADGAALGLRGCRSIRGVVALGESLAIGFRALAISANYAAQEEGDGRRGPDRALAAARSSSRSRSRSASPSRSSRSTPALLTTSLPIDGDGLVRRRRGPDPRRRSSSSTSCLISLLPDLRRVFQYHARRAQGDQRATRPARS